MLKIALGQRRVLRLDYLHVFLCVAFRPIGKIQIELKVIVSYRDKNSLAV